MEIDRLAWLIGSVVGMAIHCWIVFGKPSRGIAPPAVPYHRQPDPKPAPPVAHIQGPFGTQQVTQEAVIELMRKAEERRYPKSECWL